MPSTAGALSLPDEIIFDILTRVPVNSACRFRCVSNEWCSLISGPDFIAAHKSRHAEPLIAVYSFREEPRKGTELRLVDMDGNVVRVMKVTVSQMEVDLASSPTTTSSPSGMTAPARTWLTLPPERCW
jgi:hypothetical protein